MGQSIVIGEIQAEIPLQNENSMNRSWNGLNHFHQKAK